MSEQKPVGVIENFNISSDTTSLEALGSEVTAMKVAIGLLFQKMQDHHRTALLAELRQLDNPWMNGLADQLEQFKI
ncbi:hypothetical protein ABQ431_03600 [Serratia fonticola]|uniref:hypothetical protein n=1 Tax=Serratia fonticola TaxID=47917 RepID=UPI003AAF4345